jgi:hypothetical protein
MKAYCIQVLGAKDCKGDESFCLLNKYGGPDPYEHITFSLNKVQRSLERLKKEHPHARYVLVEFEAHPS